MLAAAITAIVLLAVQGLCLISIAISLIRVRNELFIEPTDDDPERQEFIEAIDLGRGVEPIQFDVIAKARKGFR
jgi:hypothetical protein